jgi:hypothetical protein
MGLFFALCLIVLPTLGMIGDQVIDGVSIVLPRARRGSR